MKYLIVVLSLNVVQLVVCQQRVAPGVPPQHYQQPPQQVYQQQVPSQQIPMQQHVPMQQQVPVQHHVPQQHIPIQQAPPQQMPGQQQHHVTHSPHQAMPGQILNAANIEHEKEHLGEHLNVNIDTSKMSEQELQFHYFKMHDADNNNKLDGCELIKSLIHWHEQGHKDPLNPSAEGQKVFGDEELINLIDPIFDVDDTNRDGFIDYTEFIQAQSKSAAKTAQK